jgi:hypothetical protein
LKRASTTSLQNLKLSVKKDKAVSEDIMGLDDDQEENKT